MTADRTRLFLLPAFLCAEARAFGPSQLKHDVHVYDDVFGADVCLDLHGLAVEHSERTVDGSSVFWRNGGENSSQDLTPLEAALDDCLRHLGDSGKVVEYWSRQEFINIDVHSDVDEEELRETNRILCPEWGHVLYLTLDNVRGPTCLFGHMGGWTEEDADLVVVPAVPGRVLRFPGQAMHAVPKPVDRWLLEDKEIRAIREAEREDMNNCHDDKDDSSDDSTSVTARSVILFNTWGSQGPKGVEEDPIIEMNGPKVDVRARRKLQFEKWRMDYGEGLKCQSRSKWQEQQLLLHESSSSSKVLSCAESLQISLMGQKVRRLYPKKNVQFSVHGNVRAALEEPIQPTLLTK